MNKYRPIVILQNLIRAVLDGRSFESSSRLMRYGNKIDMRTKFGMICLSAIVSILPMAEAMAQENKTILLA